MNRDIRLFPMLLLLLIWANSSVGQTVSLDVPIKRLIDSHEGQVSVAIRHLPSGAEYLYQADQVMPTASLIKLPLMVSVYGKIHVGELHRDDRVLIRDDDKVPGSGILTEHFSAGANLSLRDVIRLMIVYSDNTATNLVAQRVGLTTFNEELQQLGLNETRMNSLVYRRDLSIDPERSRLYGLGSTTARETARLLELLELGKLHSPEICKEMKEHLLVCDDSTKIKRFLPDNIAVAHKSGEVAAARCEAGIIYGQTGPIVICVLTAENANHDFDDDHPAHVLIGRIAEKAWKHFNPQQRKSQPEVYRSGMSGGRVGDLQRTLNVKLKLSPGLMIDGDFGPATEAAVKEFQTENGMEATGLVDAPFWKRLGPITEQPPIPSPEVTNRELWNRQPLDNLVDAPFVTADSWVVIDAKDGAFIGGENKDKRVQIASTTKIMTAWLVLKLAQSQPEILSERVVFSKRAADTIGSTADLKEGESVTVDELMYGLLLPSGNDAAVALAEHFGQRFGAEVIAAEKLEDPLARFVLAMNDEAARLKLLNTSYANPHGMTNEKAYGSAGDLAVLTQHAWQDPRFRPYVATPKFGCVAIGHDGCQRNIRWNNTNRLLQIEGYTGVKTGTTDAAGFCLVTHVSRDSSERIIVVLGAKSNESRYADTRNLARWSWQSTPELHTQSK